MKIWFKYIIANKIVLKSYLYIKNWLNIYNIYIIFEKQNFTYFFIKIFFIIDINNIISNK